MFCWGKDIRGDLSVDMMAAMLFHDGPHAQHQKLVFRGGGALRSKVKTIGPKYRPLIWNTYIICIPFTYHARTRAHAGLDRVS